MRHVLLPRIVFEDPKPWVHGSHRPVRIVLHDTESHDTAGVADIRGVFSFWHTQKNPDGTLAKFGAHFVVDKDGNVGRGADPTQIQWHTTNLNTGSIGIEQIGVAAFPNLLWRRQRRKQLYAVARNHRVGSRPVRHPDPRAARPTPAGCDHPPPRRDSWDRPEPAHRPRPPLSAGIRHLPGAVDSTHRLQGCRRRDTRQAVAPAITGSGRPCASQ
jgi:hypothetical protein